MISLYVVNATQKYDITNLVESVVWSGDYKQACRKLEFTILASSYDTNIPKIPIKNGNMILFYENNKELFRGFVYNYDKNSSDSGIDYVAYDYGVKLNNIKVSYNVKGKTANEMVDKVANDFKLIRGNVAKVNTKVTKVFLGNTIYEMLMTMYTQASKVDGNKYMIDYSYGKLSVIKKGIIKLQVAFEEGKNLIDSSYSESIEKMVNRVLIVDEFGNIKSEVKNDADLKVYGLFQDVLKIEEGKNATTEAKSMLQGIEQTCSLEGYGDTSCITGYAVTVKDNFTGLVGLFYIDTDTHKWEKGDYTISLGLNFKNLMNEVEAGEDENKEGASVVGGKEVNAEFTAYYPANTKMQGGFIDAMGNRLDASKLTCACPKEVAFGTKIQVKDTNTNVDNLVYKCTDRGGSIKIVNGVYHIDLLMATKEECYKFGRRKGKALIGVEVVNNTSSSSSSSDNSNVNKMIELAKTKVGHDYVWGAVGPTNFDCSGLTMWLHKQVGISIPRTSSEQSRSGKSVSKSNIQAGDLVFFNTRGSGVSHVGFMIDSNNIIHASSPKNGVKYSKLSDSYYSSRFICVRRYW